MHCLILRVPAGAGGNSRGLIAVMRIAETKSGKRRVSRQAWRKTHRRTEKYRGREMLCAAGPLKSGGRNILDRREASLCETWGCSSAGRAPALQAGGRQFDSVHLHQLHWRHFAPTVRRANTESETGLRERDRDARFEERGEQGHEMRRCKTQVGREMARPRTATEMGS